jgi:predicted CXXCH cytochrome family protein
LISRVIPIRSSVLVQLRPVRRRSIAFPVLFFLSAWFLHAANAQPQKSEYVGSDTCRSCHDEQYDSFAATAHQGLLESKDPGKEGCEACHGPGADHVNRNGDPSRIFRFQGASAENVRLRCQACHAELKTEVHNQHPISCTSCHSSHHSTEKKSLLVKATPELCQKCHRK